MEGSFYDLSFERLNTHTKYNTVIQSHSTHIGAGFRDVPHPLIGILLSHKALQRFNLQPRNAMIRYFKTNIDRTCLLHGLGRGGLRQCDLCHDGILGISRHLTDVPLHRTARLVVINLLVALVLHNLRVYAGHLFGHVESNSDERGHRVFGVGGFELSGVSVTLILSTILQGDSVSKKGYILKGALKSVVILQFITINYPSGGMILSALLVRNSLCWTDQWKLQSSSMMLPGVLVSARVISSLRMSLSEGLPMRQLFIWMHPSMDELMTYPEELKRMLIFSQMSMKIQFELFLLTETDEAEEFIVLGLNRENPPIFFMSRMLLLLFSTTSLAIRGFMCDVLVSCGCPKSIISSKISQTRTKFLRMVYSLIVPQKSFIITIILLSSSRMQEGETLKRVVATTQMDDFFRYAKLMPSMLKMGSISPFDSFTFRQNSSGVFFMRSERKSRLMMESPRVDRKNICEIIRFILILQHNLLHSIILHQILTLCWVSLKKRYKIQPSLFIRQLQVWIKFNFCSLAEGKMINLHLYRAQIYCRFQFWIYNKINQLRNDTNEKIICLGNLEPTYCCYLLTEVNRINSYYPVNILFTVIYVFIVLNLSSLFLLTNGIEIR